VRIARIAAREALFLELADTRQAFEVLGAVELVAARSLRRLEQPFPRVIPDGVDAQSRPLRELVDTPFRSRRPALSHVPFLDSDDTESIYSQC